jgi:hypothetical protein
MKVYITPQELREIADSLESKANSTGPTYIPKLNDKTGNGEFFCHMESKEGDTVILTWEVPFSEKYK